MTIRPLRSLPVAHGAFVPRGCKGQEQNNSSYPYCHLLCSLTVIYERSKAPGLLFCICLNLSLCYLNVVFARPSHLQHQDLIILIALSPVFKQDIVVPSTMSVPYEIISGTDVYGPGTFIDKTVLPVPEDARRVFEFLASQTPGFTQNKAA